MLVNSKWKRYGLVSLLVALLLIAAGCGGSSSGGGGTTADPDDGAQAPVGEAPEVIKIGQSLSRSGHLAAQAHGQDLAVQLWAEVVNEGGGLYVPEYDKRIPVEIITYDDESSADKMLQNYERLLEVDKVHLLFPPVDTSMHVAVAPFVEKHQVPMVGSSAASTVIRDLGVNNMWFVASVLPDRLMRSLVDLLLEYPDEVKTVAVAYSQVAFPRENAEFLLEYLEDTPLEVVLVKDYPLEIDDLSPLILELKELNPDAFIGLTVAPDAFLLTEQAIQYGFDPKIFEILIGPAIPAYLEMFGPAVDGILFMTTYSPDGPWPGAREMHDRYVERFGELPDYLNTAEAYQAAQVIEQAVEAVGLDWDKLREHISTSEFMTVKGLAKFDGVENVGRPPSWAQWSDGKLNLVWPESEAMADFMFPKPAWP